MWQDDAQCAGVDTNVFYPPVGHAHEGREAIRTWCEQCRVRAECLRYALDREDMWGIWGGLTTEARERLLLKMNGKTSDGDSGSDEPARRTCRECGADISAKRIHAMYCSKRCLQRYMNAHRTERIEQAARAELLRGELHECVRCGMEFRSAQETKEYCTRECYEMERNERRRTARAAAREGHEPIVICVACGKQIERATLLSRYCGKDCRQAARNLRRRKLPGGVEYDQLD